VAAGEVGRRTAGLIVAAALACACTRASGQAREEPAAPDPLAPLAAWENQTRAHTDFAHAPASDVSLGPDPYVVRALPASRAGGAADAGAARVPRFVGVLRGRGALVELDDALAEVARLPAPESPGGLAVAGDGEVFTVGELSNRVARYRDVRGRLEPAGFVVLDGVRAMRDVAAGPEGVVYVVEEHDGRLVTFAPPSGGGVAPVAREDLSICHGPVRVARVARSLVVDCVVDHSIVIRPVDRRGYPQSTGEVRIVHDGPMWGMDAVAQGDDLWVAVGGVEDHPLDRTQGSFGFVDSFVWLYRVSGGQPREVAEINTSERGLVTPKALKLGFGPSGAPELVVAAYGSDRLATIDWTDREALSPPAIATRAVPPGSASIVDGGAGSWVIANPLLDAWVRVGGEPASPPTIVPVPDDGAQPRSEAARLGEALFFTTLMAPWDKSDGRLSRFTCETCHFEGYVDGRTHHTGRADVHATTKPLVGLFNNRPHFSRALDPDLTTMVNNEFRVASANSGHDSWFSLTRADFPWIRDLGVEDAVVPPERLRAALMTFFMAFGHRPNPSVAGRTSWTDAERSGAVVFQHKCEGCHEARLVTDEAKTRQPFDAWEPLIFSRADPMVWAHADYARTGVTPYVNEQGARVVSLRRLYKKYPYFTNGSAKSVSDVLDRVRESGTEFFHEGGPKAAASLSAEEKDDLRAFLDLL
jgi:hypothetical protein